MPKIKIDHETLDGITRAGLQELLHTVIENYRHCKHELDKREYENDIKAIERVIKMYGY